MAVCVAGLSVLGIRRLSFDTDVLSLLPRDGRVVPAFRTFVEGFGGVDDLLVVFTAPEAHAIDEYDAQIAAWADALRRAPEIARVDTGLADPARDLRWLAERQLLFLSDAPLTAALERLGGATAAEALAARRELLAFPSPETEALVRQDPLGLLDLLRAEIGPGLSGLGATGGSAGYVTPDSRSRLIVARPVRPPYDTEFSRALMARLAALGPPGADPPADGDAPLPPLRVEYAGGHRIAVETEAVVRRESIVNTVGALALILPLLYAVFRSLWLVVAGPLPSALALAATLGLLGASGATLSAAATASAAMLFGLGVDGVVLLYVTHALASAQGDSEAGLPHLAGPATSMLLGMWTTAATFYGLAVVDFPSLEQLGLLIGHSMVLCGLFTLVLIPALLPASGVMRRRRPLRLDGLARWVQRHRAAIRVAALLVTVLLSAAALRIRIDPTIDRLRSVTPAAALLERIGAQFGLPRDVYVVVQRGGDLEGLLERDEALAAAAAREIPGVRLQAASRVLPPLRTQRARARQIAASGLTAAGVERALAGAATEAGFRADAFSPFLERVPQLLQPDQRLTVEGYQAHGLGDLLSRFVTRRGGDWLVVSYAESASEGGVAALQRLVAAAGGDMVLTGLPLVNAELAARFVPQFVRGLAIGTAVVLLLILAALRDWRLSLLALAPAALGLVWAAGILGLAQVDLDLFAIFAVVTFVGIGVDYGIHLIHRYRERGTITAALAELAPVVLVAAAITLLGYGTLVFSTYPPLRSIGLVSVVTVVTLAASSLLVLPAVLPAQVPPTAEGPPA